MNGLLMQTTSPTFNQDDLVIRHSSLVKRIAYHLMTRMPSSVQADDLYQSGMIGLLWASRNYDPAQGASFETYASIRVRGAMLDDIRKSDWTPRSVHRKARHMAQVMREIENQRGRDARDSEMAESLEISLDEYHRILQDVSGAHMFSLDDPGMIGEATDEIASEQQNEPLALLEQEHLQRALTLSIAGLPERERLVMSLHYAQLNLREIAAALGVTESRVCQIRGQAMVRLRSRMRDWKGNE